MVLHTLSRNGYIPMNDNDNNHHHQPLNELACHSTENEGFDIDTVRPVILVDASRDNFYGICIVLDPNFRMQRHSLLTVSLVFLLF